MSWPSIWQTAMDGLQHGVESGSGTTASTANLGGMYHLSAEQQYAMQQQNWQQWQLYQTQLAQWRYQNTVSNMMPNTYVVAAPPPLPIESTPPPPPPPLQQKTYENRQSIADNEQQTLTCSTDQNTSQQLQSLNDNDTKILTISNETQVHHRRTINLENSNLLHHERRHRNNNQNNRMFVGNNIIQPDNEEQINVNCQQNDEYVNEVKSQEEIAFDIQFRKWEESFLEWKKNNAYHPDKNQYTDFVIKMEACRKQLFARREQLRQKRLGSNMQMNSVTKEFKPTTNEWITQTAGNSVQSISGNDFFTAKNDGVSIIPGLDLESEEKVPEANLNIVAHVNNILEDPQIKTFLSNIQKQQSESQTSNSHTEASSNTFEQKNINTQKHLPMDSLRIIKQQYVRDEDKVDTSQPNSNHFEKNAKRLRHNFDHLSFDNSVLDRKRSRFPQIGNDTDLRHVHKRIRESDKFDSSSPQNNDYEEYLPVKVIDYQNRTQKQPTFDDGISPVNDQFPREIIEYGHKSKIHKWNWFCPIFQIEYSHTKTGFSLHEHPLPKSISICVKKEPRDQYQQLREPKWAQPGAIERLERFSYGSRYENSQIKNTQTSNELYYRRNSRDKFSENIRYGSQKNVPSTSSLFRNDCASESQTNPKINIKDLLESPMKRIVILMRGISGSGKSYLSKLIKDKQQEMGRSARVLSIDDYFMTEQLTYEYEPEMERIYTEYLLKSFKKTLFDNLFDCVIVDCQNATVKDLDDFYTTAKTHMFTPYICELPLDLEKCLKNNTHNRLEVDIREAMKEWERTPSSYTVLDYDYLLNSADDTEAISDVDEKDTESLDAISDDDNNGAMRDAFSDEFDDFGVEDEPINEFGLFKSKWDCDENKLARLDGTNKPIKHKTIEDYLQMDGWTPPPSSTNGKKRVRWADIEEKREQDKQRAIGFVVGQGWSFLDGCDHSQALNRVKYIEKIRKN